MNTIGSTTEIARCAADAPVSAFRSFADLLDEGFCIVRPEFDEHGNALDFRYLEVNRAFERQAGLREAVGRTARELVPAIEQFWIDTYAQVARSGTPLRFERQAKSTGNWFEMKVFPVDSGGDPRVAVLFKDVTAARHAEVLRRDSEERLRIALEAADLGTWDLDLATNRALARSLRHDRMFGYTETQPEWSIDIALAHVLEEDRDAVRSAIEEAIGSGKLSVEMRVRWPDGSVHWIGVTGSTYCDEHGTPVRMAGVVADISSRKAAEHALRHSEELFRTMADTIPHIVWITDHRGHTEFFNRQWTAYTGASYHPSTAAEVAASYVHPDDAAATLQRFDEARERGYGFSIEHRIRSASGEYRWFLVKAEPYRHPQTDEIARWFGTSVDIHERKSAEVALAEADRRKDEFLAMLAHELRNPLAPISTAAQLLGLAADDPGRIRHAGQIITRQATHMAKLVDDLLDVSRVTRGLIDLDVRPIDLDRVLSEAIEQSRPWMDSRRHALLVERAPAPLTVRGDRVRLTQVFVNLLNNAAKYTPEGGRITLSVEPVSGRVDIRVSDNGTGIEASLLPHVFDLFVQGKRSPDRAHGGLGLGLALVRTLVELHGGHVSADSGGIGLGSTFSVSLPLAEPAVLTPPPQAPASAERADPLRRVMLVDDNEDAAETLAALLRVLGHEVTVCLDGHGALELVKHVRVDMFILDVGLPGMDGYELVGALRRQPALAGSRFVALTGYGRPDDRARALQAGFDHHLVKPADLSTLMDILSLPIAIA